MSERCLLVFLIDALGHRVAAESRAFAFLPFGGGPVASVCGYSSACIPSLLTGKLPAEHGHWAMYLRDPHHSVFRRYRALAAVVSGLLGRDYLARRLIARGLRASGIRGYFSLYQIPLTLLPQFDLCEKDDPFAPGGLAPWETFFDAAQRLGLPWRGWHWRTPESERRRLFAEALDAGAARLLFFYTPLFDAVAHDAGPHSAPARACLEDLAAFIVEMLARAARRHSEVRLLVCGDHGMAEVTGVHDLLTPLSALRSRMPQDFLFFADSTMIRAWYFREGARAAVEALLGASSAGRLLGDDECRRLGVFFPDRRYGETVFLAHPGIMLVPSFMGTAPLRAMHGYHPEHEDSSTVLLANYAHSPVESILEIGPLITSEVHAMVGAPAARANALAGAQRSAGPAPGAGAGRGAGADAGGASGREVRR